MARFYSNENFPRQAVEALRELGHVVITSLECGNANQAIPDVDVLSFAIAKSLALLTLNRRHFVRLHESYRDTHCGIAACTFDPDFAAQALRIHQAIAQRPSLRGVLVRVNRPGPI